MGPRCSVWYNAVVRGEQDVVIGRDTNVQDNAVIHVSEGHPVRIGDGVSIGHGAIVHGAPWATTRSSAWGPSSWTARSSDATASSAPLVTQGMVPDGCVAFGSPARVRRAMTEEDIVHNRHNAEVYVELSRAYVS